VAANYTGTKNFAGRSYAARRPGARRRKIAWEISKQYIEEIYAKQNGVCDLSGIVMEPKGNSRYRPSIDRIDSTVGYVVGNVQIVCSVINVMKNKYSDLEFVRMCRAVATCRSDLL
jgi:hypothetical protein